MKKMMKYMAIIVSVMFVFLASLPVCAAEQEVQINETNFPDSIFREFVFEQFDTDGNRTLNAQEIAAVLEINVDDKGIADLTGIKYFTSLQTLSCRSNKLQQLDVSGMTSLVNLDCTANNPIEDPETGLTTYNMASLNISGCTGLTQLNCIYNSLKTLDVSDCTNLLELYCTANLLTELDVSKNLSLTAVKCDNNKLAQLNVKANTELISLQCGRNEITVLDVSGLNKLKELHCTNLPLASLKLTGCVALENLQVRETALTALDVSECVSLALLSCSDNPSLGALDVSNCPQLTSFACHNTGATQLKLNSLLQQALGNGAYQYDSSANRDVYILSDGALYAFLSINANTHSVTFMDENGVYEILGVKHGEKITMPAAPVKEGYTVAWEKELEAVTENVTVKAVYTKITPKTIDDLWLWVALLVVGVGAVVTLTIVAKKKGK